MAGKLWFHLFKRLNAWEASAGLLSQLKRAIHIPAHVYFKYLYNFRSSSPRLAAERWINSNAKRNFRADFRPPLFSRGNARARASPLERSGFLDFFLFSSIFFFLLRENVLSFFLCRFFLEFFANLNYSPRNLTWKITANDNNTEQTRRTWFLTHEFLSGIAIVI